MTYVLEGKCEDHFVAIISGSGYSKYRLRPVIKRANVMERMSSILLIKIGETEGKPEVINMNFYLDFIFSSTENAIDIS